MLIFWVVLDALSGHYSLRFYLILQLKEKYEERNTKLAWCVQEQSQVVCSVYTGTLKKLKTLQSI